MVVVTFFNTLREFPKKLHNNNENVCYITSLSYYSLPLRIFTTKYNDTDTKRTFGRINYCLTSHYELRV